MPHTTETPSSCWSIAYEKHALLPPPPSWGRVGVGVVLSCEDCVELNRLAPPLHPPPPGGGETGSHLLRPAVLIRTEKIISLKTHVAIPPRRHTLRQQGAPRR